MTCGTGAVCARTPTVPHTAVTGYEARSTGVTCSAPANHTTPGRRSRAARSTDVASMKAPVATTMIVNVPDYARVLRGPVHHYPSVMWKMEYGEPVGEPVAIQVSDETLRFLCEECTCRCRNVGVGVWMRRGRTFTKLCDIRELKLSDRLLTGPRTHTSVMIVATEFVVSLPLPLLSLLSVCHRHRRCCRCCVYTGHLPRVLPTSLEVLDLHANKFRWCHTQTTTTAVPDRQRQRRCQTDNDNGGARTLRHGAVDGSAGASLFVVRSGCG